MQIDPTHREMHVTNMTLANSMNNNNNNPYLYMTGDG